MHKDFFTFNNVRIPYWNHGENPRILIVSGAHGDEYSVVSIVADEIERRAPMMLDFIFIPEMSPSAVARKTRENHVGEDIERHFINATHHGEARAIMEFLRNKTFDICLSFHEDREWDGFYLYDVASQSYQKELRMICKRVARIGTPLHTGLDDGNDPYLGHSVENGYVHIPFNNVMAEKPFFGSWLLGNAIAKRMVVFEVPMRADVDQKKRIVHACFDGFFDRTVTE